MIQSKKNIDLFSASAMEGAQESNQKMCFHQNSARDGIKQQVE